MDHHWCHERGHPKVDCKDNEDSFKADDRIFFLSGIGEDKIPFGFSNPKEDTSE